MSENSKEVIKFLVIDEDGNEIESDEFNYNIKVEIVHEEDNQTQWEYSDLNFNFDHNSEVKHEIFEQEEEICSRGSISDEKSIENSNPVKDTNKVQKLFSCDVCEYKTYLRRSLERHKISHMESNVLSCKICGESSKSKSDFNVHLNKHRCPLNRKLFKCNLCNYTAKYSNVFYHTLTHYKEKKRFKCDECDFSSTCVSMLKKHKQKHNATFTVCPICLEDLGSTQGRRIHQQRYRSPDDPNMFKCPHCNYASSFKNLKRHMLLHREKEEIEWNHCSHCEFKTKRKSDLTRHERVIHQTGYTVNCEHCNYSSNDMHNLTRHIRKQHPKFVKRKDCGICGFQTYTEKTFELHSKTHKGRTKFFHLCSLCGFQCVSQKILEKHMSHHEECTENELNKLKCYSCNFVAVTEEFAILHKSLHKVDNEFKCCICSFHVPYKKKYLEHLKVHGVDLEKIMLHKSGSKIKREIIENDIDDDEEEKFKCSLCDFSCKLRLVLYRHVAVHGEDYLKNFDNFVQKV